MQRPAGCSATSLAAAFVALVLLITQKPALSADAARPRVVNVTSDSKKGWLPSEDLERQARKAATDYMAAMDAGKYDEAYAFLADIDRKDQPLSTFSDRIRAFNARAGAVKERRIVTATWTDNPVNAPAPGIYVALDLVNTFTNIDRHCGYLVLYQAPADGDFKVMREENNFLDNATAAGISKKSSPAAVDAAWASVSAHCPGYQPPASRPTPLPEATSSTIGYPNVDAALAALHSKPGVEFTVQNGWTVASDPSTKTIWSFPPPGNPAYPAAVKRQLVTDAEGTSIQMNIHCQASKEACDDLVRSFKELNAQMATEMRGHQ